MDGAALAARVRREVADDVRGLGGEIGLATALVDEYQVPLERRHAVVIGRSTIVGKPVALLLLARNATVTICHSRTDDLARHTLDADVLVAAVGRAGIVAPDMVKPGAAVVDVGITRTASGL